MHVREATPADAPAVRRVAAASWHAAHDDVLGSESVDELLDRWYAVDDLRDSIAESTPPMFVAGDDVVGFAQGAATDDGPADAAVGRIYVNPDRWGEGHGSALLARLFDAFRTEGHDDVWLAVLADNEVGRSFYDDHGFEVHEARTVELAGQSVEDVVLVREL
jgi:ribosomal protein S18 acetylase RimI-like enzyme